MKLYQAIARAVAMYHASTNSGDYADRAESLVKEHMPSGSGFDNGTTIDLDKSNLSRLVFKTAFHHMDDHGSYCGWSDHVVTLVANLDDHVIRVSGPNKRQIKDYIEETFYCALNDTNVDAY